LTPKRRSLCAADCVPRPSMKRPPDSACRSHAVIACASGLRGNATAIDVPSLMRLGVLAAMAKRQIGIVAGLRGPHAVEAGFLGGSAAVGDVFSVAAAARCRASCVLLPVRVGCELRSWLIGSVRRGACVPSPRALRIAVLGRVVAFDRIAPSSRPGRRHTRALADCVPSVGRVDAAARGASF